MGSDGRGGRRTYVGWTTDLDRRLDEHNAGIGARSTKADNGLLDRSENQ
ncbi:MAG: GIY-YIG nuclease family protein [Magnetococcales bacterium]|nr:GIY-YIG nuclease family protein [Magnetococcales bacterium]